jgi:hypothetical protein
MVVKRHELVALSWRRGSPLAATPTAGQARIEDVRPILIVAGDEGVFGFDLATDGRE